VEETAVFAVAAADADAVPAAEFILDEAEIVVELCFVTEDSFCLGPWFAQDGDAEAFGVFLSVGGSTAGTEQYDGGEERKGCRQIVQTVFG